MVSYSKCNNQNLNDITYVLTHIYITVAGCFLTNSHFALLSHKGHLCRINYIVTPASFPNQTG